MRRRNIIAALVLIAFAIVYGYFVSGLPERSLPNTPGPPFFPWIVDVLLLVLALALLVQSVLGTGDVKVAPPVVTGPSRAEKNARWRALAALGSFVVYLAVLPRLGFVAATVPFFALFMFLFGERRWWMALLGAVLVTAILYVVFRHLFGVFLPQGVLRGIVP